MTSKPLVSRVLPAVGVLAVAALAVLLLRTWDRSPPPEPIAAPTPAEPLPVSGVLRVSLHGVAGGPGEAEPGWIRVPDPITHTGAWVNGPTYRGHTENDIRGFLDGRYRYAFNQASQIHTRVGRVGVPARAELGERELLRTLHRWADIGLPASARVTHARFELPVEEIPDPRPLDLFLYQVHKDWIPGEGGVERNNFSAPAYGEVWWNEAMRDSVAWGLPGAGFASDVDPRADTPATPLGLARYHPGDSTVAFESGALAGYVQDRVAAGEPLLFLLKLSDYLEDTEGSLFPLYSSNHGDSRNTADRPRLVLEWSAPGSGRELERPVMFEYGRSITLPRISAPGLNAVSATFLPEEGTAVPRVLIRGGSAGERSDWMDASVPLIGSWDWIEIRLDAFVNPTPLGEPFRAGLRDTWVPNGTPEDHEVPWVFVSPSGVVHEVSAEYRGDYAWEVEFVPDEVGRWVYRWEQEFVGTRYRSPLGAFDVVVESREAGLAALERLTERIRSSELRPGRRRVEAFGPAFNRLERAILQLETPETFPLHEGSHGPERLGDLLDAAREALSGTRPQGPRLPLELPGP
jgi:hypothetical protein